jgi:hypothetical protein
MTLIPDPDNDPFNEPSTVVVAPIWSNADPRNTIYKRATIVILRPRASGHGWETGIGQVETKNGYSVLTSFENHDLVAEGEKWDELWMWVRAPERNI